MIDIFLSVLFMSEEFWTIIGTGLSIQLLFLTHEACVHMIQSGVSSLSFPSILLARAYLFLQCGSRGL